MVDFSLPDDLVILAAKVEQFIADEIVPLERDPRQGPHGPEESLRLEMVQKARAAGYSRRTGPGNTAGWDSTIVRWRWSLRPQDGPRSDRSR